MSGHKITGIHAIGVEIPKGMSFKELMERCLREERLSWRRSWTRRRASRKPASVIVRCAIRTRTP